MEITHRVCTKCGLDKPLSEFHAAPRGKYGRKARCKACDHAHRVALRESLPRERKRMGPPPADRNAPKRCTRCGIEKPYSEFGIARQAKGNSVAVYRSHCKECQSSAAQSNRRRQQLAKYGLTLEDYEEMLAKQEGICGICGVDKNSQGHMFVVDHDHTDGRVRGLLCHKCNRAIGLLGDDIGLLKKAIDYLEREGDYHQ